MIEASELRTGLWKNARDSVRHALEHFSELGGRTADRDHHVKWAVLSVQHSAECVCNMLLLEVAPARLAFCRNGRPWFPSLRRAVVHLTAPGLTERTSLGERRVLELFRHLADARDQIMHRTLPDDLEASVAAMSLLGLLRIARRRFGESASDIVWQSPRIETHVFGAIRYTRLEEYCRFAERLLHEEYPDRYLPTCPNCGTESIIDSHCEVCFEEMERIHCPEAEEPVFYPSWQRYVHEHIDVECPHCGKTHTA